MLNNFKKFTESLSKWKKNWVDDIYEEYKIGDKIPSHEILEYVTSFHDVEDFDDTDFYERIMIFDYFEFKILDIEEIDLDRFNFDEEIVDEYVEIFKETKKYAPPVLKDDLEIIDGTHRLNALNKAEVNKVMCFVGKK